MKYYLYSVYLTVIFSFISLAQKVEDSSLYHQLDSVIVYSSRYSLPLSDAPFAISIVDNLTLGNITNPLSIDESLSSIPGINVFNRNNLAQGDKITIRGIGTRAQFGVRGVKIFLDGIPMTFPDGQAQLNNLDIQQIRNIEILKGPSSVLYGNSMGGAILLKSKTSGQNGLLLNPSFTMGSFGLKKYSVNSEYNFSGNSISMGTYLTEFDGFRDHSDALFYGINFLSYFKIAQGFKFSTIVNYYGSPYLLNPGTLNKSDADNNPESVRNPLLSFASAKKVEQIQGGIKLNYDLSKKSKIRTVIYSALRYLDNSIPGRIIDLRKILWGIRAEYENKIDLFNRAFYLLSGVDYELQTDARQEFLNGGIDDPSNINPSTIFSEIEYSDQLLNQNENVKGLGLFSHINFNLTENIKLFMGIRYDDFRFKVEDKIGKGNNNYPNEINMHNLSFMAGLNYRLNDFITTYCNYSTGFQTPTANELSNNPFYEGGFNTSLRPELVRNYELGIKNWINNQKLFSQITFYFMDFSDLLVSYQSEDEETFYRNAGKADNFGFEALIEHYPAEKLKISASYGFMNFKFTDYLLEEEINGKKEMFQLSGNSLPGVPKNSFNTFFQYMFTNNIFCKLELSFTDKYYTNDFNGPLPGSTNKEEEFINESFLKMNLHSVYDFDIGLANIVIRLKVENLLNERYNQSVVPNAFGNNFFEPSPGRSFYINISATI